MTIKFVFLVFQLLWAQSQPSVFFLKEARSLWSTSLSERRDVTQRRRWCRLLNEPNSLKARLQRAQMDSRTWVRCSDCLWGWDNELQQLHERHFTPLFSSSVQVMLWSFTPTAAAQATGRTEPELASECTGATTTRCEKHAHYRP